MRKSTLMGLMAGLVIGAGCDALLQAHRRDQAFRSVGLVHAMGDAGFCASALNAMDHKGQASAARMLETRLIAGVRRAESLAAEGASPPAGLPNVAEGYRRAGEYLRTRDASLAASVDLVLDRMSKGKRPPPRHDGTGGPASH